MRSVDWCDAGMRGYAVNAYKKAHAGAWAGESLPACGRRLAGFSMSRKRYLDVGVSRIISDR